MNKPSVNLPQLITLAKNRLAYDLYTLLFTIYKDGGKLDSLDEKGRRQMRKMCHVLAMDEDSVPTLAALSAGYFNGPDDSVFQDHQLDEKLTWHYCLVTNKYDEQLPQKGLTPREVIGSLMK